ncbi:V-type proton ATPase 116 kDa subunit a 3 [Salvelinus sp. IW2-2015]|uniref:V-type proton ATPase 116 kDa subunit a 3 n=1 Tax=Salvelinus sp. IW2-2015 TaxID=2691554 RepID=UPI000CDF7EE6|nr:V-type proton ATPase 116 kDa subunit a [Salvelinus alpinus]
MGSMFRSEEVCLVQLFLQSGSAYNCVSELGELGLVEFRDLNPNVNSFQRKFVGEVRRCEELEKTFSFLEQEINRSLWPPLHGPLPSPCPTPSAPQPRDLLTIEEESERLARELKEVSRNRDSLRAQMTQLSQYKGVLTQTHSLTSSQGSPPPLETVGILEPNRQDVHLSFVAGVVHPWKVPSFERLLWRACRGYIIVDFREMEEQLELPVTGEMQWTVFLISYWGDQIGQKVKKICDWPRDLLTIEEESERLARELKEVSRNRDSLRAQMTQLSQYKGVLTQTHSLTSSQGSPPPLETVGILEPNRQDVHLSFVAGVVHPWKVPSFERLLWRACRGYIIVDFREMEEQLELPVTGEMQWTVFLISYWGDQIGQKVKKICDWSQTEHYLQQLLVRAVAVLPQWKVRVQKSKAVQAVLNLCSPSVTDKCLIAEAWCPVSKLPELQSALREGGRKSGSGMDSFYNRLPCSTPPPTLFPTNSFTAGFQSIVEAYGVASYREVNPAVYTIITFPFLFAVMFGDVGHGLLMFLAALWMVLEEKDPKLRNNTNEIWRMMFGGRYLILLMGLFSVYTGAIYNECFSRGLSPFSSGWHVRPMFESGEWSTTTLKENNFLSLDPNITGVFTGPYPFGIDPIWGLSNNHLTFLNSYKMKMSVIIGVIHMTFGVCLSFFNYKHFNQLSSVFLVLIPELFFMLCLFGYLVFMVIFKWLAFDTAHSNSAPSILIHFIDMFLFTVNKENPPLYKGQIVVQKVLVVLALCSVPVLLLGKPIHQYITHKRNHWHMAGESRPLLDENNSINAHQGEVETGSHREEEFDAADVFMHQAIHTIEYCLGCISNTASYLRLWALSLAHAQLSEVLWVMVMRIALNGQGYVGSVVLFVVFSFFAVLTVSILLVMEGLSAFLHALRLHWVEFQNKFYSGTGYKLNPFAFSSLIHASSAM